MELEPICLIILMMVFIQLLGVKVSCVEMLIWQKENSTPQNMLLLHLLKKILMPYGYIIN